MLEQIKKLSSDKSGSFVVITALMMLVIAGLAAISIDAGSFYYQKRRLQSATDLAALAAAANPSETQQAAAATLALNGFDSTVLQNVETGTYSADPSIAASQRFTPGQGTGNAVRLTTQVTAPFIFGSALRPVLPGSAIAAAPNTPAGQSGVKIAAQATAAQNAVASFAIGSGLASLNGGILNSVLGGLLGTNLSLSVMDYQALASANIDLFTFSNALATRANLTGVTYNQLASGSFQTGDVWNAVSTVAAGNPNFGATATAALAQIVSSASNTKMSIAPLVSYGPYGGDTVGGAEPITATVSALDLVSAIAQIANGTHQVQAALNLNIPGVASANLQLTIGERPVGTSFVAVGQQGATVHTAQTRLLLTVQLVASGQSSLVNLPIYIELASGTARLSNIQCTPGNVSSSTVTLAVTPAVANAWIGNVSSADMVNFSTSPNPGPATLLTVPNIATVTGSANAAITNLSPTPVTFSYQDILQATRQTTNTTDFVASLLASLFGGLHLQVNVLGLGLGLPTGLDQTVSQTLVAATDPIDQILTQLLGTLGLGLGQAYTWVSGVTCGGAVLVN